jgi:glycerol-3-phosphate acyltransferase PlsX
VFFEKPKRFTIAVDVMSGDNDPEASLGALSNILDQCNDIDFVIFGLKEKLDLTLKCYPKLQNITVIYCEKVIGPADKPSLALRNSKNSSIRMAVEYVKEGKANAVISSGNTGALMAISRSVLGMLPNVHRPAIIASLPTIKGKPVALVDAGANTEVDERMLFEFAVMGEAFARITYSCPSPRVALLNIGVEDIKGKEIIKSSYNYIKENSKLNLVGYIEGNTILEHEADVVVTDGFTGNIVLKTIEGTAKLCEHFLKVGFKSSIWAKIGYLLARKSLKSTFVKIDKRSYNGAMLVGLNGVVVKSHGSADEVAFEFALKTVIQLARDDINARISQDLELANA